MIKLNESNANANVNVLGEAELTQVVGGCHRRRHGGYGYGGHCGGGWRRRERGNYGHCGGYESYESYDSSDSYEGDDYESSDESSSNNVQVASVDVTVNIAQVQG